MGSSMLARNAGYSPDASPTMVATMMDTTITSGSTMVWNRGMPLEWGSAESSAETKTPPPAPDRAAQAAHAPWIQ